MQERRLMELKNLLDFLEENHITEIEGTIELGDSKTEYEVEVVYDEVEDYDEGTVTRIKVVKIDNKYFRLTIYSDSWGGDYDNEIEEVVLTGYKQVPLFESVEEEV